MTEQLRYRPLKALKVVILLLMTGLMLILGVQLYYESLSLNYILQLKNGARFPLSEIITNDRKRIGAELDFAAMGIPTAIVFLCILFRLRRNVEAMGVRDLPISAGWIVGYFFIPILNLLRPFHAVRDLWKASQPVDNRWQMNSVSPIVGVWWFLWIASGLLNFAVFFSFLVVTAQSFREALIEAVLTIVVSFMTIVLVIVATWMLIRLMQMQDKKYQKIDCELTCSACGETIPGNPDRRHCPVCGADLKYTELTTETVS